MTRFIKRFGYGAAAAVALSVLIAPPARAGGDTAAADSTMKLKGGEDGTVFRSLTVEGEDRIRIEFERPSLDLDIDPASAPGLEWDNTRGVLDRGVVDLVSPLLALSALEKSPYMPRPWLDAFASGDIVRFRPALEGVDRWRLTIANSQGMSVVSFEGRGNPPEEIGWNGCSAEGEPMPPGLTYSHILEAEDRAGNKRNFVGHGFELPSYRIEAPESLVMLFSGREAARHAGKSAGSAGPAPPVLLEAAGLINQSGLLERPVRIDVTARAYEQANSLALEVAGSLKPLLLGDPARILHTTRVRPDAPADGTVEITVSD